MEPAITIADLFGPNVAYNPNASYLCPGWMQGGRAMRDFRTGDHLSVAGDLHYLCSRAVCSPAGLELLAEVGLPVSERRHEYDDAASYAHLLKRLETEGRPMIFQHVHPVEEFGEERYVIPRELLRFLNNKANLEHFVPPDHVPLRQTLRLSELSSAHPALSKLPLVLKAATNLSSGGGRDVRICRNARDVEAALPYFGACEFVVVEEFLEMERSPCMNFAASPETGILYLGSAEQVTTDVGRYVGNWLEVGTEIPAEAVAAGHEIMERAVSKGYRGIAGIDVAIFADRRSLVYDLNFRLNGCTGPVLWMRAAHERLGEPVMRYRAWEGRGNFSELIRSIRSAVAAGRFLPLGTYDPALTRAEGKRPRVSGLVAGASRRDVRDREAQLARLGLTWG